MMAIGGVSSALGSIFGSNEQAKAQAASLAFQKEVYGQSQKDLNPYVSSGHNALNQYDTFMGNNGADAQNTAFSSLGNIPGYQYALGQGEQSVMRNQNAAGLLDSGQTDRALQDYGQNAAYGQYQTTLGNLFNEANMGQTAATNLGNIGNKTAATAAPTYTALGNANAGMYGGVANALTAYANNTSRQQGYNAGYNSGLGGTSPNTNALNAADPTNSASDVLMRDPSSGVQYSMGGF